MTPDGTAEPVSRDQTLRRERRHEQYWQPYPVDPYYSCYMCDTVIALTCRAVVLRRVQYKPNLFLQTIEGAARLSLCVLFSLFSKSQASGIGHRIIKLSFRFGNRIINATLNGRNNSFHVLLCLVALHGD